MRAQFITAAEVAEIMGISRSKAYQIVREMNRELKSQGYRQGLYPRLFPRRPRPLYRTAAGCGFHGQLSDILPQEQGRSYTSWKTG